MVFMDIISFAIACLVIIFSGFWFVKYLGKFTRYLKLGGFLAGFVILSFATSLPEFLISITSALGGYPNIVLGTIIGSSIANLTIVIGISVLFAKGIRIERSTIRRDSWFMFGFVILAVALMGFDRVLGRIDGLILISAYVVYMVYLMTRKRVEVLDQVAVPKSKFLISIVMMFVLAGVLYLGSNFMVIFAESISLSIGLPSIFIALIVVALVTTIPDLAVRIRSISAGKRDLAIDNTMGNVITNLALALGIAALINPLTGLFLVFVTSAAFLILASFLFITFLESEATLTRREGLSLVLIHVFFLVLEFYIATKVF